MTPLRTDTTWCDCLLLSGQSPWPNITSNGIRAKTIPISATATASCQARSWLILLLNIKPTRFCGATSARTAHCSVNMERTVCCWAASATTAVVHHYLAVRKNQGVSYWRNWSLATVTYFLICWTFAITKARGTPISSVVVGWNTSCYLRNEKLQPYKHWSIK